MKNLILIVSASVYQAVTDHLRALGVAGFTVTHVEGHDDHTAKDRILSARDRVVGFVPQVRVEVLLAEELVDGVLAALADPRTGLAGHGTYWVSPIERAGRF